MFQKNQNSSSNGQAFETIIGSHVKVEGNLTGKGNILVQGTVEGKIETENDVTIEEGAIITADIKANNAHIAGEINGNLDINNQVILKASSNITGDINASSLEIQTGACFNGKSSMTKKDSTTKPETKPDNKTKE